MHQSLLRSRRKCFEVPNLVAAAMHELQCEIYYYLSKRKAAAAAARSGGRWRRRLHEIGYTAGASWR